MLLVPTRVGPSMIEGLGVIAEAPIKAGTRVWTFDSLWDHFISEEEFLRMPKPAQKFLKTYAYHNSLHGPGYIVESDNGRFMNHANRPNLDFSEGDGFAIRDIAAGEELTCDYTQCCEEYFGKKPFNRAKSVQDNAGHSSSI